MCLFVNSSTQMPILSKQRSVASNSAIGHCSMPNSSCGQLFFNYLCHFDRTTVCGEISHYYCFTNRFLHACGYAALCRNDRVQVITTHLVEMTFFIEHISNQAKAAATFSLGGT